MQDDGRATGDRVLAFRFADAAEPENQNGRDYWPKAKGLCLQDFPALAELRLTYDEDRLMVRVERGASVLVKAGLDANGRHELESAITDFVAASAEGSRLKRPGRLPLVLVGDGRKARFQDRARGYISLHSRASVEELGSRLSTRIDDRRFRSNIVIDGVEPWTELTWSGTVRIGDVRFTVEGPIVRCPATHANPDTGVRDAAVLSTLTRSIGQAEPSLGRLLLPVVDDTKQVASGEQSDHVFRGGSIRLGDEIVYE